MPELPEVETITRALRSGGRNGEAVVGQKIESATLLWEKTLATPSPGEFAQRITGKTIQDVGRRGKLIVFDLQTETLLIHLRMSGDIRVEPAPNETGSQPIPYLPHDRLVVQFTSSPAGKLRMAFNDPRKFGRVWLVKTPEEITSLLGPEPLSDQFTTDVLYHKLQQARRQIKPLLMDQTFLAGLGNIYTDEALYQARIHPLRSANGITFAETAELWSAIRNVLAEGIRRNGASIDWMYRGGDFQTTFQVYQRAGQSCMRCGTKIERILVSQRGTHFCPHCQRFG